MLIPLLLTTYLQLIDANSTISKIHVISKFLF